MWRLRYPVRGVSTGRVGPGGEAGASGVRLGLRVVWVLLGFLWLTALCAWADREMVERYQEARP